MFKKLVCAAFASSFALGSALAADLPSRSAPALAPPAPIFTWTGIYLGVNAGYGWSNSNNASIASADFGGGTAIGALQQTGNWPSVISLGRSGFIGGGQLGYNRQLGSLVIGLEADFQGLTGGRSTLQFWNAPAFNQPALVGAAARSDTLGTVRGRLGFAIDRTLLYVTGGLAYGSSRLGYSAAVPGFFPPLAASISSSRTGVGYALGAGVEYALTTNWSVKAEYLYYDLGRQTLNLLYSFPNRAATNYSTSSISVRNDGHIVRAGLNYRFGWGSAPVVAKY